MFSLRKFTSKTILSNLTNLFTNIGIPQGIQSDRGSNFTSDLFEAVLGELGITQTLNCLLLTGSRYLIKVSPNS